MAQRNSNLNEFTTSGFVDSQKKIIRIEEAFTPKHEDILKAKPKTKFQILKKYFSKKIGRIHPLTATQQSALSEMSPERKKQIELITYKMLNMSAQFEELWKDSDRVIWHRGLHAFMIESLNELANDVAKAQQQRRWPNVKITERK